MLSPDRQILIHRLARLAWQIGIPLLVLLSLLDHTKALGYHGDDWQRFDRQSVTVRRIMDGENFDCDGATVHLLGIRAAGDRATDYARLNLAGRSVRLRLDVPQTRDAQNRLLAYVYFSPTELWNEQLILDGYASIDRQSSCSMLPVLSAAQQKARSLLKHKSHS